MSISNEDLLELFKIKSASAEQPQEDLVESLYSNGLKRQVSQLIKRSRKVDRLRNTTSASRFTPSGKNVRTQLRKVHKHIVHVDQVRKRNEAALRKSIRATNKDLSKVKAKNKVQDHKLRGQEGALDALMMHRLFASLLPPKLKKVKLSVNLPNTDFDGSVGANNFAFFAANNSEGSESGIEFIFDEKDQRRKMIMTADVLDTDYDATQDMVLNMLSGIWQYYKGGTNNFMMPLLLKNQNESSDKNRALLMMMMSMNQK